MITCLNIKGLAIIDSLAIDFSPGFNVITGETGAGKSILIRALNLLLGAKARPDTVRKGNEFAIVSGEFSLKKNHRGLILLENWGIPIENNGGFRLLVRRQIGVKGRSQAWVNDVPVTTQTLKELGMTLVDVFGQHENQRLLDPAEHPSYVNAFVNPSELLGRMERKYHECEALVSEIRQLVLAAIEQEKNRDYFEFRFHELEEFKPSKEDFESLETFSNHASVFVKQRELLSQVIGLVDGNDGASVSQTMREVAKILGRSENLPNLKDLSEKSTVLSVELENLSYELNRLASQDSIDEKEFEEAQKRIFKYQEFFRKYGVRDIDSLVAEYTRLKTTLVSFEALTTKFEVLLKELDKHSRACEEIADELSKATRKATALIQTRVKQELCDLAMRGASFSIELKKITKPVADISFDQISPPLDEQWKKIRARLSEMSDQGREKAEFFLSSNPGEPVYPLVRIASGGELSRIMLALKKAMAVDAETCVLVFDEIDTGISGRTADVVGFKMRELSKPFQVICISHLPQVAVYADTHFLVKKESSSKRMQTQIVRLSTEESIAEIARLLSGAEVSALSLANAKNLKKRVAPSKF